MKKLLIIFTLMFSVAASAQSTMNLYNKSSMTIEFNMFLYSNLTCGPTTNVIYTLAPNTSMVVTAPVNEEFVFAEIVPIPYCSPGFGVFVSTPSVCNSSCPSVGPNWFAGPNGGCAGGLPTVNVKWTDCGAPGEGYLTIIDY